MRVGLEDHQRSTDLKICTAARKAPPWMRQWGMPDAFGVLLQRLQSAFDHLPRGRPGPPRPAYFQANGALLLAKRVVGRSPQQVAAEVVAAASLDDLCEAVEVSGPGFINLTLSDALVADQVAAVSADRPPRGGPHRGPADDGDRLPSPTWPRKCTSVTCAHGDR